MLCTFMSTQLLHSFVKQLRNKGIYIYFWLKGEILNRTTFASSVYISVAFLKLKLKAEGFEAYL